MLAVTFRISGARYAVPCSSVVEVIPLVALSAVPQAPRWLRGALAYRGKLTPVVDLCELVAGYACPERLSSRIVLFRCHPQGGESLLVGLLAEHMTDVRRIQAQPSPEVQRFQSSTLGPMLMEEDGPLLLIDERAMLESMGLDGAKALVQTRQLTGEADRSPPVA